MGVPKGRAITGIRETVMQVLKSFEFPTAVMVIKAKYEWETLLDGQTRRLEEGTDYECKPNTFKMMAGKQARKRGLRALVCKVEGGLVIQAVKADEKKEAETEEPKAPAKKGRKGKGK
jgi:hypothetical protein